MTPDLTTQLLDVRDEDFAWMLAPAGPHPTRGLTLPPGGVEPPDVLSMLREMTRSIRRLHPHGSWLIVSSGEVVGLCGYLRPANDSGQIEIGFGITPERRGLGHATRAVAALLVRCQADPLVREITARSSPSNLASGRVLAKNNFVPTGTSLHPEDGELIGWCHQSLTRP